jgi:hypothetical protein
MTRKKKGNEARAVVIGKSIKSWSRTPFTHKTHMKGAQGYNKFMASDARLSGAEPLIAGAWTLSST